VTPSRNAQALMRFLLEFRGMPRAHQMQICARVSHELRRTNRCPDEHAKFLRALERYLLAMAAGSDTVAALH
jgi:hypothetical protein